MVFPADTYDHSGAAARNARPTQAEYNLLGDTAQGVTTTLGVNPQNSAALGVNYATVDARLEAAEGLLTALGQGVAINLRVTNGASPNTQVVVTADVLAVAGVLLTNVSETATITSTGAGGRDATDTETANTWYAIWIGYNPSTADATAMLSSVFATSGPVTKPSGYTHWRRVGAVRNNGTGSGDFLKFLQQGSRVFYDEASTYNRVLNAGTATTQSPATDVACASVVPPSSRVAFFDAYLAVTNGTVGSLYEGFFRQNAGNSTRPVVRAWSQASNDDPQNFTVFEGILDASQIGEYFVDDAAAALTLYVRGYDDPVA